MLVGPELGRVDARGWERLGGEKALGSVLLEALWQAGMRGIGIGIGDVVVVADAAARLAKPGPIIVPPAKGRDFLATLPLKCLPISEELQEAFRALGWRRIGQLAERERNELEARFGPAGLEIHRWACGEDDRAFHALPPPERREVSLEFERAPTMLEPLLFTLRHLLARLCSDLTGGLCASEIRLRLNLEGSGSREATVILARPTQRESRLFDLCRAALERFEGEGKLTAPISGLALELRETAPAEARQGDLFRRDWRVGGGWDDPLGAAIALARLQARLGEEAVVTPAFRADHRPESRSVWMPVTPANLSSGSGSANTLPERYGSGSATALACATDSEAYGSSIGAQVDACAADVPSTLQLLSDAAPIQVRTEEDRLIELRDDRGRHEIVAAEGPERLSGDWWKDPYRREYFRVCTSAGELLWLFREYRPSGELRWWLHGWWD
jgi:protein ImuB